LALVNPALQGDDLRLSAPDMAPLIRRYFRNPQIALAI
jgi:hypothetical protein